MTYNSDRLSLNKADILAFCDRVIEKWSREPEKTGNILAMSAIKASVVWTDEETLRAVWDEIVGWSYQLLYENAMAQADQQGELWSETLGSVGKKLP